MQDDQTETWDEFLEVNTELIETIVQCQEQGNLETSCEYQDLLHDRLTKAAAIVDSFSQKSVMQTVGTALQNLRPNVNTKKKQMSMMNMNQIQQMNMMMAMQMYCMSQMMSNCKKKEKYTNFNASENMNESIQQTYGDQMPVSRAEYGTPQPSMSLTPSRENINFSTPFKMVSPPSIDFSQLVAAASNASPESNSVGQNMQRFPPGTQAEASGFTENGQSTQNTQADLGVEFDACDSASPPENEISVLASHTTSTQSLPLDTKSDSPSFGTPLEQHNTNPNIGTTSDQNFTDNFVESSLPSTEISSVVAPLSPSIRNAVNPLMLLASYSPPPFPTSKGITNQKPSSRRQIDVSNDLATAPPNNRVPIPPLAQQQAPRNAIPFLTAGLPPTFGVGTLRNLNRAVKICAECRSLHRTTRDCRERYCHTAPDWDAHLPPDEESAKGGRPVGGSALNKGRWTADEDHRLKELGQFYGTQDVRQISFAMGGSRTSSQIRNRLKELGHFAQLQNASLQETDRWSEHEEKRLEELVKIYGRHAIKTIHKKLGTKTPDQIRNRLSQYLSKKKKSNKPSVDISKLKVGPWTPTELQRFEEAVEVFGEGDINSIVCYIGGSRTAHQVRTKLNERENNMNTNFEDLDKPNVGPWSEAEIKLLENGIELFGIQAPKEISRYMDGKRTVHQIRTKIKERKKSNDEGGSLVESETELLDYNVGPWSSGEMAVLCRGIELYGYQASKTISQMNGLKNQRTPHQVKTQIREMKKRKRPRYSESTPYNESFPQSNEYRWSLDEDKQLLFGIHSYGASAYTKISGLFHGRHNIQRIKERIQYLLEKQTWC